MRHNLLALGVLRSFPSRAFRPISVAAEYSREGRAGLNNKLGVAMHDLQFTITCEAAPVQVEGTAGKTRFYFRARHDEWNFAASSDPAVDPLGLPDNHAKARRGTYPNAGYMPHETALDIIRKCLAEVIAAPN